MMPDNSVVGLQARWQKAIEGSVSNQLYSWLLG